MLDRVELKLKAVTVARVWVFRREKLCFRGPSVVTRPGGDVIVKAMPA
jgi:hypothetical protein